MCCGVCMCNRPSCDVVLGHVKAVVSCCQVPARDDGDMLCCHTFVKGHCVSARMVTAAKTCVNLWCSIVIAKTNDHLETAGDVDVNCTKNVDGLGHCVLNKPGENTECNNSLMPLAEISTIVLHGPPCDVWSSMHGCVVNL
jgi:hypothetical protein